MTRLMRYRIYENENLFICTKCSLDISSGLNPGLPNLVGCMVEFHLQQVIVYVWYGGL